MTHVAQTLVLTATLAVVAALARPALAEAPEPAPVACALEHTSVRDAIASTYDELRRIHRTALPGPRGRELVAQRVEALVTRSIHVETFTQKVLRQFWPVATPEQQVAWRTAMETMLRRRYLKGLDDPDRHRIEVRRADVSCAMASTQIALVHVTTHKERVVDMELVYADGGWRVYDVSLDGASLVRTWRSRFARVHREGGLDAVDREMTLLAERYVTDAEPF